MGRNSNNENILVRFINAITMNVCDKQKLEQLFTELHVLIKVDYGISITTMNIFEKYDELKQIVEATLSTILKVGSCLKNVDNQSNQPANQPVAPPAHQSANRGAKQAASQRRLVAR